VENTSVPQKGRSHGRDNMAKDSYMKDFFACTMANTISVFAHERTDLEASMEIKDQIEKLNARLARYLPPRETWTLADEAPPRSADMTFNAMTAQEQEYA
jgi:hypothetical protein